MVRFELVTKKYGNDVALNNISFTLETGKVYGLIGPNGSGKSTTLKMIAGLVRPTSGIVKVNGMIANRKICRHVAYLTELDTFYPSFTVRDMLEFTASQFIDFDIKKARELVAFLKLDDSKTIKQLSKGNRGRMKLVLTLARNTDVMLLDEPFSGLDPLVRESIVKSLISFLDFEKQTVIIATHEINEIEPLLDEVLAINNGKILAHEPVEQLREREGVSVLEWMKQIFYDA